MKRLRNSVVLLITFLLFTVLVSKVDVQNIGPGNTAVGFASINGAFHSLTNVNMALYKITDFLGYLALVVCVIFGGLGVYQLVQKKNLFKVDSQIILLGCLYVVTIILYVVFEKVVINYRPIIMPTETMPEPSFPSSHTMLTIVVMSSAIIALNHFVKKVPVRRILQIICAIIMICTVIGRLVCGVHWFTDIIGGILIASALIEAYSFFYHFIKKKYN